MSMNLYRKPISYDYLGKPNYFADKFNNYAANKPNRQLGTRRIPQNQTGTNVVAITRNEPIEAKEEDIRREISEISALIVKKSTAAEDEGAENFILQLPSTTALRADNPIFREFVTDFTENRTNIEDIALKSQGNKNILIFKIKVQKPILKPVVPQKSSGLVVRLFIKFTETVGLRQPAQTELVRLQSREERISQRVQGLTRTLISQKWSLNNPDFTEKLDHIKTQVDNIIKTATKHRTLNEFGDYEYSNFSVYLLRMNDLTRAIDIFIKTPKPSTGARDALSSILETMSRYSACYIEEMIRNRNDNAQMTIEIINSVIQQVSPYDLKKDSTPARTPGQN